MQIRTRLQHLWATGVEAVGEVYGLEYKSPDIRAKLRGKEQMRERFLTLSSHLFAREEKMPGIPGVVDDVSSICSEIVEICDATKILKELAVARSGIVVASDSRVTNISCSVSYVISSFSILLVSSIFPKRITNTSALKKYLLVPTLLMRAIVENLNSIT